MSNVFKRLASGGLLRVITLLSTVLISFFMMPFVIHSLGDKWYGLWIIIGSLMGYYSVMDFGLLSATQRYIAKAINGSQQELLKVFNTSSVALSILGFFILLVSIGIWASCEYFVDDLEVLAVLKTLIIIAGVKSALMLPFLVYGALLSAKLRFDIAAYLELFKLFLRTLLIVYFLLDGEGILALAYITLGCETVGYFILAYFAKKQFSKNYIFYSFRFFDFQLLKELVHFGKFAFINELGNTFTNQADSFVVSKYQGLAAVTHYNIALTIYSYAGQFISTTIYGLTTLFTISKSESDEKLRSNFLLFTEITAIATIFTASAMIIFGGEFIVLWMGDEFADSYDILIVFGFVLLFNYIHKTSVPLFFSLAMHKKMAYWSLGEGILNLIFSIVLVKHYGLIGVALGSLIACILFKMVLYPAYACKLTDIKKRVYWKLQFRYLGFFALVLVSMHYILLTTSMDSYLELILIAAAFTVVFSLITLKFLVGEKLRSVLRENIPKLGAFL
jgi:O-antigen/teichoic acid export membrane protein